MRPTREEAYEAAARLVRLHGAQILATARRYSAGFHDAEDAYQRAVAILLTKAPTTREEELLPWVKTVAKHEAFALRRERERAAPPTEHGVAPDPPVPGSGAHERAERYELLRMSAEALGRLKPQEARCIRLRAQGYSYREICALTDWSYTKVNRCLTEGRAALRAQLAAMEAGALPTLPRRCATDT